MVLDSKRGQYLQLMFGVVILVVLAFVFVAANMAGREINTALQAEPDMDASAKAVSQENIDNQSSVFDAGGVFVLVGVWILCLGLAYQSQGNPILFVAAFVVIIALGFVCMALSNTWDDFSTSDGVSSSASGFPMMNWLLSNYLVVLLAMGMSVLIVGFSRQGGF